MTISHKDICDDLRLLISVEKFAHESNMIEGIFNRVEDGVQAQAILEFLSKKSITINDIVVFNAYGTLRSKEGEGVTVSGHKAPDGPLVRAGLENIVININKNLNPYQTHVDYEMLHPMTDGNGRSGRVIWLWMMINGHGYDFSISFLHQFYYQALSACRGES